MDKNGIIIIWCKLYWILNLKVCKTLYNKKYYAKYQNCKNIKPLAISYP